jgi:hypothetical protein
VIVIMKKFGIFLFSALMLLGVMSCEKSGSDKEGGNADSTSTAANNVTTPADPNATEAEPVSNMPLTTVEFMEESHNFGEVAEGDKVEHVFKFKNTGSNPLKINNVKPSCGCTTPDWTKDEVAPGAEGFVKVEFDSKGKRGVQKKSVTVTFENTDPKNKILSFNCEVTGNE